MKAKDLQHVLRNTPDTVIKEVSQDHAQDPFVLYKRKYRLQEKRFFLDQSVVDFFAGEKLVVMDCKDDEAFWVVKYWIHKDEIIKKETG